ncbi:hypothetical protein F1559_004709 [Cyanidiococcus yangmingshanensis]|uniref:Tr-type G domain-containing protein n=1 Tax=Cyanidiococcus yangmingshanensis TaxID=2690220 RepID=A0A7J7IPG6_9RHOD|nr:hypothetical protein F1559_004709 [Cyanidiococcus yangmingshanensis]
MSLTSLSARTLIMAKQHWSTRFCITQKRFARTKQCRTSLWTAMSWSANEALPILSKNTAVRYRDVRINVIDTPGHADFGGEVQRVLSMADAMLLVVDSVEGPRPQTRYVLREALQLGQRVLVVINKIDRPAARPVYVVNKTFDLFVELGATDEQADFPIVYTNISYDEYKGLLGIGRICAGTLRKGQVVRVGRPTNEGTQLRTARVDEVFLFENLGRVSVDGAHAGDIVTVAGIENIRIGDTVCDAEKPLPSTANPNRRADGADVGGDQHHPLCRARGPFSNKPTSCVIVWSARR